MRLTQDYPLFLRTKSLGDPQVATHSQFGLLDTGQVSHQAKWLTLYLPDVINM